MSNILSDSCLLPVSVSTDASIYRLDRKALVNNYYIVSTAGTRRLMAFPEVVGYDSYLSMVESTQAAMKQLISQGLEGEMSILTILRGGLNYPLEECCHRCGLKVGNMSFISCERIIQDGRILGLDTKYEKLHLQKGTQLMIGDILASGDTIRLCLRQVIETFRDNGCDISRILFFTVGGTRAIEIFEEMTPWIRSFWPDFKGFDCVFYEGIFTVYTDKGCTGVNIPMIDFGWKEGLVSPEFRSYAQTLPYAVFEKCIIYDGGARRYEIPEHIEEVCGYWEDLLAAAEKADFKKFIEEKTGRSFGMDFEQWLEVTHYGGLSGMRALYDSENAFLEASLKRSLVEIASTRLSEFKSNMQQYE